MIFTQQRLPVNNKIKALNNDKKIPGLARIEKFVKPQIRDRQFFEFADPE